MTSSEAYAPLICQYTIQAHDDSQPVPEVKEKSDPVQQPTADSKSEGIVIYG